MATSSFGNAIEFFDKIGIFDVVLPFIFIFTLVFAMLEKTRIFGVEKSSDGNEYTRKNMNAMAAFSIAFFAVASANLVGIINKVAGQMVILLLASFFFLLLAGSFHQEKKEGFFLEGRFKSAFMGIMFVGLVAIFLNAIKTGNKTWLEQIFEWVQNFGINDTVPSIVLVLIMIGIILYITSSPKSGHSESGNK